MELTVCVYNLENFFLDQESFINTDKTPLKSEKKTKEMAQTFREIDADIYALSEVGGMRSLEIFNEEHLDSRYTPLLLKGNSDRGIELGFYIKKDLNFSYEMKTNTSAIIDFKFEETEKNKYKLSRDLQELYLSRDGKLELILLNVHLKSQRDETGRDFRGEKRRKAEFTYCLQRYAEVSKQYPEIPIFIVGDFNGNASRFQTDPEFIRGIHTYDIIDVLDFRDIPREQRATFYLFKGSDRVPVQLDYAFTSKKTLTRVSDATVYRYKNELNNLKFLPRSRFDIWDNPSDHYPLVFTLNC
ncbi:endonuclease/exonuclease/phosphatase [Bacteriovorax sp. Seq25_V]|uniref:endonuclease/exonuclease/phosphatase family protein n=1 Tax=Bacteriovorax sp. Seq25_V TaxID=1201288 RepID=UPI00038A33F0|nr:endonuclease/exonuclease/phosphatase [Bacteriovorax sp. Seq25_V]EQC45979.1 endonuclease/exonuclease/phosphatase family protein [Bacteriovorax sp. Seq25_V]